MRRHVSILAIALFVLGAGVIMADQAVLIDFSTLKADILPQANAAGKEVSSQNRATMMDFSATAGRSFKEEELKAMRTSLAVANWEVVLASSSKSIANQRYSYTLEVPAKLDGKDVTVLGIRVHFPVASFNSWARIKPPFEIPAFEAKATVADDGKITPSEKTDQTDVINSRMTRFEGTYDANSRTKSAFGVVKNVGVIKKVVLNVKCLNFPHGISVVLKDENNEEKVMFMGYLDKNGEGWRELTWENPAYITEIRNRELRVYPLYPKSTPFFKFDSFIVQRDAESDGGDFVAYVRDVKLIYDKAVPDMNESFDGIEDEDTWGIIKAREDERKRIEAKRFGNQQVLRYLESKKIEVRDSFETTTATK